MKKYRVLLAALAVLLLFTGAVSPVEPTRDFYVNDYASVLFREHREFLSATSRTVLEETGAEVVLLAVPDNAGLSLEDYAARIAGGWSLAPDHVLLLYFSDYHTAYISAGGALSGLYPEAQRLEMEEAVKESAGTNSLSIGLLNTYKTIVRDVFSHYGVVPDETLAGALEEGPGTADDKREQYYSLIFFVVAMLLALRALFISRRYQKKYGKPRIYRRKKFAVERREYDEDDDKGLIGYDD